MENQIGDNSIMILCHRPVGTIECFVGVMVVILAVGGFGGGVKSNQNDKREEITTGFYSVLVIC